MNYSYSVSQFNGRAKTDILNEMNQIREEQSLHNKLRFLKSIRVKLITSDI